MLRPPDIVVLVALLRRQEGDWTIRSLAEQLHMPPAAVQRSLARLGETRLFDTATRRVSAGGSDDLFAHALPFIAPATLGGPTRGMPTAWGAVPLVDDVAASEPPPVWPDRDGVVRGPGLVPLHASVPLVARSDPEMYQALALIDALRVGWARERGLAIQQLRDRLIEPAWQANR